MRSLVGLVLFALACDYTARAVEEPGNLADNPGFEKVSDQNELLPKNWVPFSSATPHISSATNSWRSGQRALRMEALGRPKGFQGVNAGPVTVQPGLRYSFSAFVISDRKEPISGTAHGMLVIEWHDAQGNEISRVLSGMWKASSLSRLRWEQLRLDKVVPPKGAATAVFGIHLCEGDRGGSGAIWVDDVVITAR